MPWSTMWTIGNSWNSAGFVFALQSMYSCTLLAVFCGFSVLWPSWCESFLLTRSFCCVSYIFRIGVSCNFAIARSWSSTLSELEYWLASSWVSVSGRPVRTTCAAKLDRGVMSTRSRYSRSLVLLSCLVTVVLLLTSTSQGGPSTTAASLLASSILVSVLYLEAHMFSAADDSPALSESPVESSHGSNLCQQQFFFCFVERILQPCTLPLAKF